MSEKTREEKLQELLEKHGVESEEALDKKAGLIKSANFGIISNEK